MKMMKMMKLPLVLAVVVGAASALENETSTSSSTSMEGKVDCAQYQESHSFVNLPISMNYVVTQEGVFSAEVIYEGQGYVSWGLSPNGRMTDSLAVIGLPDTGSVQKWAMAAYTLNSITPYPSQQQTLLSSSIQQNDTHTVLQFSKLLKEDNEPLEITADGDATNYFLVAAGANNNFGQHAYRAAVGLTLTVCQHGAAITGQTQDQGQSAAVTEITFDTKQSLFQAHGWVSVIAWGILAPLAVTSSMCRHLIPKAGLWYQIHFYFNVLVFVLTVISFALAYKAIQATQGGAHFQSADGAMGKHKTIGLVLFILVILQATGGMVRPAGGAEKTTLRALWEVVHKGSGVALLAMGYYQCHSGLVLYARRFVQENDYVNLFWAIAGTITGVALLGRIHKELFVEEQETKQKESPDVNTEAFGTEHMHDNMRDSDHVVAPLDS